MCNQKLEWFWFWFWLARNARLENVFAWARLVYQTSLKRLKLRLIINKQTRTSFSSSLTRAISQWPNSFSPVFNFYYLTSEYARCIINCANCQFLYSLIKKYTIPRMNRENINYKRTQTRNAPKITLGRYANNRPCNSDPRMRVKLRNAVSIAAFRFHLSAMLSSTTRTILRTSQLYALVQMRDAIPSKSKHMYIYA